jgi:hypothetical protein
MIIIFELVKSFEFEIKSDNSSMKGRVDLLQNIKEPSEFRFSTSELEMFRLIPVFPMNEDNEPLHTSDDLLWVKRTFPMESENEKTFVAASIDEAKQFVLSQLEFFHKRILLL